ncbi:uncharacterized protein LOC107630394 isoform X2 [Arachis ipaensis]|uniref:Uncharacterized protein n=1 Tax=Arachis hypogaea TaxID=3818 RepID=A0A445A202_ARAHY|nr:uncharacterized protein LOC107630394 isoform X2 [Arachis ipaensis]XP_025644446.1 uncharacterized protein LOC112738288 isoform X2 [Arachis hypogaea]QHO01321.1 uncharacterized protein DS421_13g414070 [Arachis hypogaea]RYR20405.1 hypothetical protein Ahy_B03g065512 [Arachis hypogaea]
MADSNSKDVAYSVSVKEEVDAKVHSEKSTCHHHRNHSRETHGVNNCIDENTSLDDVKAPNLFERAKEEFQALAQLFHQKKEAHAHDTGDGNQIAESKFKHEIPNSPSEKKAKSSSANLIARTKKEIKAIIHNNKSKHHHHHKETHGRNDDIDENTPANEVKGPNVFGRVKEEFEAVLQAILPKKGS